MAKQQGIIKLIGKDKSSNRVFVENRYGEHTRSLPRKGSRKTSAALQLQYSRNGYVNPLASKVSQCLKNHTSSFASRGLYHKFLSLLRKEPSAERLLLLDELNNAEINPAYPFERFFIGPIAKVTDKHKCINVRFALSNHAMKTRDCNSYFLEATVLCWNDIDNGCIVYVKKTGWLSFTDALPLVCDLPFVVPAGSSDYLVALRCVTGYDNIDEQMVMRQGMKIIAVGSLNKQSVAMLQAKRAERESVKKLVPKKEVAQEEKRIGWKKG